MDARSASSGIMYQLLGREIVGVTIGSGAGVKVGGGTGMISAGVQVGRNLNGVVVAGCSVAVRGI